MPLFAAVTRRGVTAVTGARASRDRELCRRFWRNIAWHEGCSTRPTMMTNPALFTRLLSLAALLPALGCSSTSEPTPPAPAPDNQLLAAPASDAGFQLKLEIEVPPGVEGTWCQYFVLPKEPHDIGRYQSRYTPISHHLIAYQTALTAADPAVAQGVFDCDRSDRLRTQVGFHFGTQTASDDVTYPDGIGKRQQPSEVVMLEYHAINPGGEAVSAEAAINFWYSKSPIRTLAETLFFYQPTIFVAPGEAGRASMHCEIDGDISLLYAQPHMHRRGVGFEATVSDTPGGPRTPILETQTYEVGTTTYEPFVEIIAGQAIDFTCHYQNSESFPVIEGSSAARNEMCTFASIFIPRGGSPLSTETRLCDGASSGTRMHGTTGCAQSRACVEALRGADFTAESTLIARDRCYTSACQSGFELMQSFMGCQYENCRAECVTPTPPVDQAACDACERQHCGDLDAACVAHAC